MPMPILSVEQAEFELGFAAGKRDACKQRDREIAEAVAKERERCAELCDAPASEAVGFTRDILRVVACTIRTGGL